METGPRRLLPASTQTAAKLSEANQPLINNKLTASLRNHQSPDAIQVDANFIKSNYRSDFGSAATGGATYHHQIQFNRNRNRNVNSNGIRPDVGEFQLDQPCGNSR